MKKSIIPIFALALVLAFVLTACSMGNPAQNEDTTKTTTSFVTSSERKIVYLASFTINCKDLKDGIALIENSLQDDEWFDSLNYYSNSAYFVARVKTSRLDDYIKNISESAGENNFENYRLTAADVSLDYYDSQGKIEALEAERERLLRLMESDDTSISDTILINTRLGNVDFELQKLRGELYRLDSQLDYSVITINVTTTSYAWIFVLIVLFVLPGVVLFVVFFSIKLSKKKRALSNKNSN